MLTQEQEIDSIYEGMNGYGMFPTKHLKTYLKKAYAAGMAAGEAKKMEQEFTVTAGCGNSGRILPNGMVAIGGGE